jgi:hypothetical protein
MIDDNEPQPCNVGITQVFDRWHVVLHYTDGELFMSRQTYATEEEAVKAAKQWVFENVVPTGGVQ